MKKKKNIQKKDISSQAIHALNIDMIPKEYHEYFKQEEKLLHNYAKGSILDVAVGIGRELPYLFGICSEFLGIDKNQAELDYLQKKIDSKELKLDFPVKLICGDAQKLEKYYAMNIRVFDTALCLWNSLSLIGNEAKVLYDMSELATGDVIITLAAKNGISFDVRKRYYQSTGFKYTLDEKTQTIKSNEWNISKAYTQKDLEKLAKESGTRLKEVGTLTDIVLYGIYERR